MAVLAGGATETVGAVVYFAGGAVGGGCTAVALTLMLDCVLSALSAVGTLTGTSSAASFWNSAISAAGVGCGVGETTNCDATAG